MKDNGMVFYGKEANVKKEYQFNVWSLIIQKCYAKIGKK